MKCYIEKIPLSPAVLSYNGSVVAEWKIPVKNPFKIELKLLNNELKDDVLLILGILHTYYFVEGS